MKQNFHIKDYQVHLPPLGEGTFGTVYRATYRGISERALKVFKPDAVDLPTMARELEKLSSMAEHPGIVTLHDFDLLTSTPFYAMSLHADGKEDGTWRSRSLMDVCGKRDAKENARLIDQMAAALAYLHRHQILHCDVKPTNVMLTDENPPRIKICDFGQSRGINPQHVDAVGTPLYSSPEQLSDPGDIANGKGFRWDVYSFGVLCYRLITGKLPRLQALIEGQADEDFEASIIEATTLEASVTDTLSSEASRITKLIEEEPDIIWPEDAKIDHRRKMVITKCLSLDPKERFLDMREVRNEIIRSEQERRTVRSRNWSLLFGAITGVAILASALAFHESHQAREASAAEQDARQDAEELVNFIMFDLRQNLGPMEKLELLEHIADNADTYLENLSKDMRTVQSLKLLANILRGRGDAAIVRGLPDDAIEAYQKAFNILDQLSQNGQGDPSITFRSALILVGLGDCYRLKEDLDTAAEYYDLALEMRDLENASGPSPDRYFSNTAEIFIRKAELQKAMERYEPAIDSYDEALRLATNVRKLPDKPPSESNRLMIVNVLNSRADTHLAAGERKDATDNYEDAIEAGRDVMDLFESSISLQAAVAYAYHSLGLLHLEDGELVEALIYLRQELLVRQDVQRREPRDSRHTVLLARCYASVAKCYNLELPASRSLALENLMRAVRLLETMRDPLQFRSEREELIEAYRDRISEILEMEE
ncbi:MAG: protein kinase [Verrucomicrobiota bacterium]